MPSLLEIQQAQRQAREAEAQNQRVQGLLRARLAQGNVQYNPGQRATSPAANLPPPSDTLPSQFRAKQDYGAAGGGLDYEKNPLYWRPTDTAEVYNARVAQANASRQSPPSQDASQPMPSSPYRTTINPANNAPMAVPEGSIVNPDGSITRAPGGNVNVTPGSQGTSPPNTAVPSSFPGIIGSLLQTALNNPALAQTQQQIRQLGQDYAKQSANILGSRTNLAEAGGEQGLLQNLYQNTLAPLQTQLSQQTQQQGLIQQALQSAAGITAPQQLPYNVQYVSPLTGQPITGGAVGGGLAGSIPSLAQAVTTGQMTIDQANGFLGNTTGLTDQLRAAVQRINPNFNFALSSASARTQAEGQTMQTSATAANQALDSLQVAFNNLPGIQRTGIPILNQLTQAGAMTAGLGRPQASAYQGALQEARKQIATVLAPLIGVEGANAQANSLLPDNMIPSEIPQKIEAAKLYIRQRVTAFVESGQQPGRKVQIGSSIYNF